MREKNYNWKLKKALIDSGLKQSWVAHKVGIDGAVLTKYITGERIAPKDKQEMIAKFLDCEVNDIFED